MKERFKLALGAWLAFAALPAPCQIRPNVTVQNPTDTKDSRNVRLTVTVMGYKPGQTVTGTNQCFSIYASLSTIANASGSPDWNVYYLKDFTLTINGDNVPVWAADPNSPAQFAQYSIRWDTTHFKHGTSVTIECKADAAVARTDGGQTVECPVNLGPAKVDVPVSVYNFAFCGEVPWVDSKWPTAKLVSQSLKGVNYGAMLRTLATESDCVAGIVVATAYYFSGDGLDSPSSFGHDGTQYNPPLSAWLIGAQDVQAQRSSAEASGGLTMSFAFLDCCLTGANNQMESAFLYPLTAPVDAAEMGWKVKTYGTWGQVFTPALYKALAGGSTVSSARDAAYAALTASKQDPVPPKDVTAALALYGDGNTKLHGLYGVDDTTTWYSVVALGPAPGG